MDIFVYIDAGNLSHKPLFMGVLRSESVRGKEVFSFRPDDEWVRSKPFSFLDADLKQFALEQYVPESKPNFGVFMDSCPDRWGRVLMQRRERIRATAAQRPVRRLSESDYLLGVYDGNRMGALRFKTDKNGPFLDNDNQLTTPPMTSMNLLEQASLNYEKDNSEKSSDFNTWLRMLYAPGSSLGGARPKANVMGSDGSLWIAKFPSHNDHTDVGAWEYVVILMAKEFGLRVPECRTQRFSSRFHTFLTRRFDRGENGIRLHFASAMTLLGYTDGSDASDGASYLEMAELLRRYGTCKQKEELIELWKRIVFNIAISNCDDHLRNHGFILTNKGWNLSPAFDLNPDPQGLGLKLNISETDNSLDFELALSTAQFYGLTPKDATDQISLLKRVVSSWRAKATRLGISRREQEEMSPAFASAFV